MGWLGERTGLPYGWSVAAVVPGLLVLAGGAGWLLERRLAGQAAELVQVLPQRAEQLAEQE